MRRFHSTKWRSSVQPRKQRKYFHNAPLHLKGAQLHVHLSKELRQRHRRRSLRVRTGDTIKVLRGTHKGKQGKVERVDVKRGRIYISKVEMPKRQGGASRYPLRPSNCIIVELTMDKRRLTTEKKQKAGTPGAKPGDAKTGNAQSTMSGAPAAAPGVQKA